MFRMFWWVILFVGCESAQANDFQGFMQAPKGSASSFSIDGWSCMKGDVAPVTVRLLVGSTKSSARAVLTNLANQKSESAINKRCETDGQHRFKFDVSQDIINQYSGQNLYIQTEFKGLKSWVSSAKQYSFIEYISDTSFLGFVQSPKGDTSAFSVSGWSCQKKYAEAVTVILYAGSRRDNAQPLIKVSASKKTEDAVRQRCDTDGHHRFKFDIPQDILYQYSGKNIYIKAILADRSAWISSSQQYAIPEFPETKVSGHIDGIKDANGAFFVMGWSCQINVDDPVSLTVTTRSLSGETIFIAQNVQTNTISEQGVSSICKSESGRHRFRVRIPEDIVQDYGGRSLYIESRAAFGEDKTLLGGSGHVKIPSRVPTLQYPNRSPNIVVFFTDDQGYADLGIQDVLQDVVTPNIDSLALNGARFTQGYVTAPQCSPSRAAMITGLYQERFGMDENHFIPMSIKTVTLASRLKNQGYKTGMLGKWHLEIMGNSKDWGKAHYPEIQPFSVAQVPIDVRHSYYPHKRGFDEMVAGYTGSYLRNMDMRGKSIPVEVHKNNQFRVDLVSDASLTFIDKHWESPFYLYVSHYAPHVPMEATQKYLDRFPEDMPLRRRYALAMLAAIDDGVGNVVDKLKNYNLLDNTLILFISDNGAPLGDDMTDAPLTDNREAWNGSRNDPYTGEKGMLTEGALRVPFIAHWPKQIRAGLEIDTPVSTLDAAYTTAKIAGVENLSSLDGLDLISLTDGQSEAFEQRPLYWRFYSQRAIRQGNWKYMQAGIEREYLFDMSQAQPERVNYINSYPTIANELKEKYWLWAKDMQRPEPLLEIPAAYMKRVDLFLPKPLP